VSADGAPRPAPDHTGPRARVHVHPRHGPLKQLRADALTPAALARLLREGQLTRLAGPGTVRAAGAPILVDGRPALPLEPLPARPLGLWVSTEAPSLARRLRTGAALTRALGRLHALGITHGALAPEHVLVLDDGDARLVGLGDARLDARGWQEPVHPRALPGDLAYLAPERTGRLGRTHDARADLYALGVLLHELITGARPFRDGDPLALLQAHLARRPPRADRVVPALPGAVADVLQALMARRPESRPVDPEGIASILEGATGGEPGPRSSPRFSLPTQLYGRHEERRRLIAAGERVRLGECAFLVLSADYGIGKRALVSTLFSGSGSGSMSMLTIRLGRDDVVSGSPILQAVAPLVRRLAAEREGDARRERLRSALGDRAGALVRELPILEAISGAREPPPLPPQEHERRLELASLDLLRGLAGPDHPIVILIEDCERLDAVAARLCGLATGAGGVPWLLLVGTTADERAARTALDGAADPEFLPVSPLHPRDTTEYVADLLYRDAADVEPLARRVHRVALGNPQAVRQVLERLRREDRLFWDADAARWDWRTEDLIRDRGLRDPQWALRSLDRVPAGIHTILAAAAVIGERFGIPTLARALDRPEDEIARLLAEAVGADLLAPDPGPDDALATALARGLDAETLADLDARGDALRLAFPQPGLQRALYAGLEEDFRAHLHNAVGRQHIAESRGDDARFREGVHQLDLAHRSTAMASGALRELALLNRRAGRSALADGRPQTAFRFLRTGLALLGEDAWSREPEFATSLILDALEAATLCRDARQVERLARSALARPLDPEAQLRIARHLTRVLFAAGRGEEAMTVATAALDRVGLAPVPVRGGFPVAITRLLWGGRRLAARMDRPGGNATAPAAGEQEAVSLLMELAQGLFYIEPVPLLAILQRLVDAGRRHPSRPEATFALAVVAGACALLGLRDDLLRFATRVETRLAAPADDARARLRARMVHDLYVVPWLHPPRRVGGALFALHRDALALGDVESAAYAALGYASTAAVVGDDLGEALARTRALRADLVVAPEGPGARALAAHEAYLAVLHEEAESGDLEAHVEAAAAHTTLEQAFAGLLLANARLLAGDADGAHQALTPAAVAGMGESPGLTGAQMRFVGALAALDRARSASGRKRRRLLREARRARRVLDTWIGHGLGHLRQRTQLIDAELLAVAGRDRRAAEAYERAVHTARVNGFVLDEALAWERAARHGQRTHRHEVAERFEEGARDAWQRAGARAPLRRLHTERGAGRGADGLGDDTDGTAELLAAAVALAAGADLDSLVTGLVEHALDRSGAERVALVLRRRDGLALAATSEAGTRAVVRTGERPLAECGDELPVGLVQRVARTGTLWVADDASAEESVAGDPYVTRRQPRSVLVVPLRAGERDLGVLYAEHRERFAAFPPARVERVRLLVSHAAAALETARLHDELARARDEYRDLFENAAEGLFRIDLDGRLRVANGALAAALGYPGVEDLLADVSHLPRDVAVEPEQAAGLVDAIRRGGALRNVEVQALRRDGALVWLEVSARVVRDPEGRPRSIEGSLVDVTARRERMQADQAREVAEAATEAKSRFLAAMSHEIRTPMNAVLGFTELALGRAPRGALRQDLETIRESGRSLLAIVDDVLDLSRVEAGRLELDPAPMDLPALLRGLRALLEPRARERDLTLVVDGDDAIAGADDDGRVPRGDAGRLRQVLLNLLDNAIKFTPAGRVELTLRATPADGGRLRLAFAVADTGIGIAAADRERLFEPFEQLDRGASRRRTGTGLGLAISRQLVDAMGGTLTVAATPEGGSRFAFELVLPRVDPEPAGDGDATEEARPLEGRSVLLAEDNALNRRLAQAFLESAGARVETVVSGRELLERLDADRRGGASPDAVLMDLHMPEVDGLEACRRLRAGPGGRSLVVIAVTADAVGDSAERAREAGFDDFVLKPVDRATLVGAVLRQLVPGTTEAPPRAAGSATFPPVAGLDVDRALAAHDGRPALLREMLGRFPALYGDAARRLHAALGAGRRHEAARLAHDLHGVAGSFGAQTLRTTARELERALEGGEVDLQGPADRLEAALAEVLAGIRELETADAADEDGALRTPPRR
jgi:PAS domain S-box-containing protein